MNHPSHDQLREYQFKLLDENPAQEIATHLENCAECRATLAEIKAQFKLLDLLKEQPAVSESTLAAVLQPPPRKPIVWLRPLMAVAAGLAVVLGLFQLTRNADRLKPGLQTSTQTAQKSLDELRAEKPFAPASNIELNVLPRRDAVQLTIYNAADLTLVRETRKLVLKRGWNWLQFMWSNTLIDPTSLSLEPQTHAGEVEITQLVYPPRLKDLARWTIFSEVSGEVEFDLTYFTSGLKWNAFYEATLSPDEQKMQLRSYVRVDNASGEKYENAQTRLVVGKIKIEDPIRTLAQRKFPYGGGYSISFEPPALTWFGKDGDHLLRKSFSAPAIRKKITKKRLSEYQLYTIEGTETIPDGWGKRLPSFEAQDIGVTNLYKFEAERWGTETMRYLSFANTEVHQLGKTPLPKGQVRVFGTADEAGNLVYVGASNLKYIPVGEEIELKLGVARKVKVEPKLMRTRTDHFEFDSKGNVSGWDEITSWKIVITNARNIPVKIEIMRSSGAAMWSLKTAAPFEKYDASHFRFITQLEPQSKQKIEYELTTKHGTRQNGNRSIK